MLLVYQFQAHQTPDVLSKVLWRQHIGHQIQSRPDGVLELWLQDERHAPMVLQWIRLYENDPRQLSTLSTVAPTRNHGQAILLGLRVFPITMLVIVFTLAVALLTQLGQQYDYLGWFTITPIIVQGSSLYTVPLAQVIQDGQVWRFLTPAFLHFSIMHLAFNLLWVWDLGRKLERLIGSWLWSLGFTLLAVSSNLLQYWDVSSPLFGGLSGVVYGLVGFAWLMPLLRKQWPILISKGLMLFFLVWLLIGYTDIPASIGLGNMANTAHLVGLIAGLVLASLYRLFSGPRSRKQTKNPLA